MSRIIQSVLGRMAWFAPGGELVRPQLHRWRGVQVGQRVWISKYVYIDELYPEAITLGDGSTLALRCSIFAHFHRGRRRDEGGFKAVVIEPEVFVGPHCVVLPGVRIGRGSVIKAGTVISRNIPPGVFWGANADGPLAKVTVPLTPDNSYEDFVRGLLPIRQDTSKEPDLHRVGLAPES